MYNFSKVFFSRERAEAFKSQLAAQGIDADIWMGNDYLNPHSTMYYVKWNLSDDDEE